MTTLSRLIAAATLISATTLAPGLAAADERHERDDRRDDRSSFQQPDREDRYIPDHDDRYTQARSAEWRGHERGGRLERTREVRRELYQLDLEYASARARFAYRPWRLARLDGRFQARRAELVRELRQLTWLARR